LMPLAIGRRRTHRRYASPGQLKKLSSHAAPECRCRLQVRTRLAAGGRWIRTSGSWSRDRQTAMGDGTTVCKNGSRSVGEPKARIQLPPAGSRARTRPHGFGNLPPASHASTPPIAELAPAQRGRERLAAVHRHRCPRQNHVLDGDGAATSVEAAARFGDACFLEARRAVSGLHAARRRTSHHYRQSGPNEPHKSFNGIELVVGGGVPKIA
jgi:hypothetical protein